MRVHRSIPWPGPPRERFKSVSPPRGYPSLACHSGDDRLQAVEDWLRVEGYAYRFRQKRWRVWTRTDRPGLRRTRTPTSTRKRDKKWREYQESLAAEAAQAAKGGTPAPSPQRASCGHHPGHTTLGYFLEVAKQAKAKPRPLHLRKSGPSSDVESAHRGRILANQASSRSSVAPDQRDVARVCERACGVPCNLRVARQRATQQNAAVEGAVGIAQEEAADWGRGMAFHALTVAAIAAGLTAAAAQEAATARVRGEVAAAAQGAHLAQEAIARKEAEVKALEEGLAQERAKKEAEESAHAEATAKAQADAARKDTIEAARRKVAEERARTEAELAALEAGKARLQQAREAEAARAREEAERRATTQGRRNGGGGDQAPARDPPGRIPSGDPSKALQRGRLLQDDAGSGGG